MRVRAYTNRRLSALAEGYREGDPLELCYEAERPDLDGAEPEDVAETMFGELNHDRRPNPAFPALSVGHVVYYRTVAGDEGALAAEFMGWRAVPPPPEPTDAERELYRRKIEAWYLPWAGREQIFVVVRDEHPRLWEDDLDASDERSLT